MIDDPVLERIVEDTSSALKQFSRELDEGNGNPVFWEADRELRSWTRDFIYELNEVDEELDFLGSFQITSIDLGDGRIAPILQLSFFMLDGIDTTPEKCESLNRELSSFNIEQLCVKWTLVVDEESGLVTGVCASSETFIQTISPEFLSIVYNALLSAVIEKYTDMLALCERIKF